MAVQMKLFETNESWDYYWQDEEIYSRWKNGETQAELARDFKRHPTTIRTIIVRRRNRDENLWKAIERAVAYLCFDAGSITRTYNVILRNGTTHPTLEYIMKLDVDDFVANAQNAGTKVGEILKQIQRDISSASYEGVTSE